METTGAAATAAALQCLAKAMPRSGYLNPLYNALHGRQYVSWDESELVEDHRPSRERGLDGLGASWGTAPFCYRCSGWVLPSRKDTSAPECGAGCDLSDKVCHACNCAACDLHGLVEGDKRWCSSCACALMMCSVDLAASRCSLEAMRGTASIGVSRQMDLHEMEVGGEGRRQREAFRAVTGCVEGTCYPVPPMHSDLNRLPYRRKILSHKKVEPPALQHEACPMLEANAIDIGPNAAEDGVHQWKAEREREAEREAEATLSCATRVQAARLALSGGRRRAADSRYLHYTVMQRTDVVRLAGQRRVGLHALPAARQGIHDSERRCPRQHRD